MVVTGLSIAGQILGAIQTLFGFGDTLKKAKLERRARMSDAFDRVAACLEGTATQIRAGEYPSGRCQELLVYSKALPDAIRDEVGDDQAEEIGTALGEAHKVEGLFADRHTPRGIAEVNKLDDAAGLLRALATLIRL